MKSDVITPARRDAILTYLAKQEHEKRKDYHLYCKLCQAARP